MTGAMYKRFFLPIVGALWLARVSGFTSSALYRHHHQLQRRAVATPMSATKDPHYPSRRSVFEIIRSTATVAAATAAFTSFPLTTRAAADALKLDDYLYKITRVREATQQERRLISTGKFKDKARQNVKLAVKFMIQNYQLSDSIVAASAYLQGSSQMRAVDVGQAAVQNLQTILEYFDAADVQNIKVGK